MSYPGLHVFRLLLQTEQLALQVKPLIVRWRWVARVLLMRQQQQPGRQRQRAAAVDQSFCQGQFKSDTSAVRLLCIWMVIQQPLVAAV